MPHPRQTPRSLAVSCVVAAALLVAGCSSAELAISDYEYDDENANGDGAEGPANSGSDGEGDGDGDGDGDGEGEGAVPEGSEDPAPEFQQCSSELEQLIVYDLEDAQAELAATLVRESVLAGPGEVPDIPLGVQPFFNAFEFNYPPAVGSELEISGELWKLPMVNPEAAPRYRLQYAIRAPQMLAEQRLPVDLAIVVDLGPSMTGEPLVLVEEALAAIEAALVPGDRVTLIGAAEEPELILPSVVIENFGLTPLTGLLDEEPAPTGNVGAALGAAYETIGNDWDGQGQPRVLLISNGHFVVDDALVGLVDDNAADSHYLVSLALGDPTLIADGSLRQLAEKGQGSLLYERDAEALWVDFQQRFTAHMIAVATELEMNLSLPPGLTIRERDPLIAPQQVPDGPELAMLGANDMLVVHHELESCAELDPDATIRVELEWNDPLTNETKLSVWEQPVGELGFGSMDTRKGAAVVAYARALRGYRDGKPPSESFGAVLDAISLITEALEAQPEDPDLVEMSQVLGKLEG